MVNCKYFENRLKEIKNNPDAICRDILLENLLNLALDCLRESPKLKKKYIKKITKRMIKLSKKIRKLPRTNDYNQVMLQ